jgi:hypothetical protein
MAGSILSPLNRKLSTAQSIKMLCIGIGALLLFVWIGHDGDSRATSAAVGETPTKAEWIQKVYQIQSEPKMIIVTGDIQETKDRLFGAVGPPTSTQAIGNDIYLYWRCSDGEIQLVADRGNFGAMGFVAGKINSY